MKRIALNGATIHLVSANNDDTRDADCRFVAYSSVIVVVVIQQLFCLFLSQMDSVAIFRRNKKII